MSEPPRNLEAEARLLSTLFKDPADVHAAVTDGVTAKAFDEPIHREVFECLRECATHDDSTEISVVWRRLAGTTGNHPRITLGDLTSIEGLEKTTARRRNYTADVLELWRKRALKSAAVAVIEQAGDPAIEAFEIIADLRTGLERIADTRTGLGTCVTAADLCASPPPVPPEIIHGMLYRGGTAMLSGPSKARKTYTFLDLAVSVSTGRDWLGFITEQSPVLYLNLELAEHSFQRRLAAICAAKGVPPPPNLYSLNVRGRSASIATLAAELPRLIKRLGAGLVVLDPWYKISAQSGAEENSNDGQARVLAEAERIVTSEGAALLLGHHFAKGTASDKNAIDRAAGAGAMARWGDVIATLSEHEEANAMTLEMHLRDFAPVSPVVLRWEQPLWRRDASLDPAKLKQRGGRPSSYSPDAILGKLIDGKTSGEWRAAVGMADTSFRRHRDALVSAGKVRFSSGAYYRT